CGASSERMSIRQPVRRAARRAFWPSLPIASDSWKSGTMTRAARAARSTISTEETRAGDRAWATISAGSSDQATMSVFSPCSSLTLLDYAGDDVALLARELTEGDVVLGVTEALEHDLASRARRDPAEAVGGVVVLLGEGAVLLLLADQHVDVAGLAVDDDPRTL